MIEPGDAKMALAHRVAWELTYGESPDGKCVLHTCDTPSCVNPNHLRLGSQLDNIKDMDTKGRRVRKGPASGKAHKAKLTFEQVEAMRSLAIVGLSYTAIGREFGVSKSTAARACQGKTWKR